MITQQNTPGRAELAALFREFIDPAFVIDDVETQRPYECDGLFVYCEMPLVVVLPETVEQVRRVVRICHERGVPIVARGAGTGLSAGALPDAGGVLLSLARFTQILDIDPLARTARVQPGVRNAAISEAAAAHQLFYAPDPSSQVACTIGGNVAENSGGLHCLKYGLTLHNVLKLRLLTAKGEEIVIGSDGLDVAGCDLLALMIGSEGLLGIVTEVTVRLLPRPAQAQLVMAAFDSTDAAGEAVSRVIARGVIPAALEMMDHHAIVATEAFVHAGYPVDAQALLLCELDGHPDDVAEAVRIVADVFRDCRAASVRIARAPEEQALLWTGRKAAFPAMGRLSPDYYCMDGTIPRSRLAEVLRRMERLSAPYGLRVANVFHAGDGNLHPLVLFDSAEPGQLEKALELGGKILELCVEVGGCITGEHGVGVEKLRHMPAQFSEAELTQLHQVKHAFDPTGILNPGKGVPLLKHCQEYRAIDGVMRRV